jgi:hypothetical protein
LRAFTLRPLAAAELADFVVNFCDEYILQKFRAEFVQCSFPTHFQLAHVVEALMSAGVLTGDMIGPFLDAIMDQFVYWAGPVTLMPERMNEEPFIDIFCPLAGLIEQVRPSMFRDLLEDLLDDKKDDENENEAALDQYAAFLRVRKRRSEILKALKNDDPAAFALLTDEDLAQEILGLFGVRARDIRPVSAALCGARRCLEGQKSDDPEFIRAQIWGGCSLGSLQKDEIVTRYAISYHRYDLPLVIAPWVVDLAIEADNANALRKLAAKGIPMTESVLNQAVDIARVEVVLFLLTQVRPSLETLERAVRSKHPGIVKAVVQSPGIDVNARLEEDGWTALHFAASLNLTGVVEALLSIPGINANIQDDNGVTPIAAAIEAGAVESSGILVEFLLPLFAAKK